MRLLVLGGTSFLGRHTVAQALRRGWQVTTFNRGQAGPDAEGVEVVRGDRTSGRDLEQLADRAFDVVVDTCGFVPAMARQAMEVLAAVPGRRPQYVYVSSISAVETWPERPTPADAEARACPSDSGPDSGGYGELKAGCERAVSELFPDSATLVRAGAILGPYENVNRLPWWLARMERGGEVLAPGDPDMAMQLIDARDIATFMLDCGEQRTSGTFSVTGPRGNATMRTWLEACRDGSGGGAALRWLPDDVLLAHDVEQWTELPLRIDRPGQGGARPGRGRGDGELHGWPSPPCSTLRARDDRAACSPAEPDPRQGGGARPGRPVLRQGGRLLRRPAPRDARRRGRTARR